MVQLIEEVPGDGKYRRYPWNEWTDGKARVATQGEDFTVRLESFRTSLHIEARNRGLKCKTSKVAHNQIAFQFYSEQDIEDETDYGDVTEL